jgi:chlorophyllide a reductase subunit X
MVVAYKVGGLTYFLSRWMMTVKHFTLINILLEREAVPEYLQEAATPWALAEAVAIAPPIRPAPLSQDELLNLFSAESTGKDFVLTPATDADMRGKDAVVRASLEVVYDNA